MRRVTLVVLAAIVALALSIPGAMAKTGGAAGTAATPGVTSKSVTIGGTFPLTGPASLYAPIPSAMKAYFSYINGRKGPDGKRGVNGRQIKFIYYDDGYNPANTVQQTRKLVEQDKVFADVGSLGTEPNLAIRPYLNQLKVPQLLVATGAQTWGRDWKKYPWTTGWQPDYVGESIIYGQQIKQKSSIQKVAVLYQNDDYGKDYLYGLVTGAGSAKSKIVAKESYEVTASDVGSQVLKLKASGADTFVVFGTPKFTIGALVVAKLRGWNPSTIYVNSVSGTNAFMIAAQKGGAGSLVNNVITVQYAKDPASPDWTNDAGMKLYKSVMAKYDPSATVTDGLNLYGVAVAHAFVQLLQKAGPNPTRDGIMKAFRHWNQANPFLLPGNLQQTGPKNQYPVRGDRLVQFQDGQFKAVTGLLYPRGKGL